MALNRELPHLLVLPEDDATRSIAVGFSDYVSGPMQILTPARGWIHVKEEFLNTHLNKLVKYPNCHMVLLIDFDGDFDKRMDGFRQTIPENVASRVYVLGALDEAENLKKEFKQVYSAIGQALARECEQGQYQMWLNPQLQHNTREIQRLNETVRGFVL